ncbi:MAG: M20/M25/M40 family metallo-hydrolase, partial [Candidatus Hydrogenedentes bacterium]|nr:M20/M25/M40 family metallo-hydrolase [Candidatus Hydrogenedentota bacterium]
MCPTTAATGRTRTTARRFYCRIGWRGTTGLSRKRTETSRFHGIHSVPAPVPVPVPVPVLVIVIVIVIESSIVHARHKIRNDADCLCMQRAKRSFSRVRSQMEIWERVQYISCTRHFVHKHGEPHNRVVGIRKGLRAAMEDTAFNASRLSAFTVAAGLAIAVAFALWSSGPPRAVPAHAPPDVFSAERAFAHVLELSRESREMGTPAQLRAIDYIVAQLKSLEVNVEPIDETLHFVRGQSRPIRNIVARIPGTQSTKSVVLMAHHDSVAAGPGAADDASGVAAILETVRALKSGPPLRNDVIVLVTDGEELGLYGAKLFVAQHPWMRDVGLVMNFDGTGSGGPVLVPEITVANGWIVALLAESAPYLRANSFMRDVQKRMPNSSDVTPFREAGVPAMNFNFIARYPSYHSAYDVPARLSIDTLQHFGEYALPLTRRSGQADLSHVEAPDRVYFDVAGLWFVHYPAAWAPYCTAALAIVYALALYRAAHNGHARIRRVIAAALAWLALCIAVCAASFVLVRAIEYGTDRIVSATIPRTFNRHPIHWAADLYLIALVFAALAAVFFAVQRLRRRLTAHEIVLGGLALCVVLAAAITVMLRGGSGLFTWPPLFAVLSAIAISGPRTAERIGPIQATALVLGALPTVMLLAPGIELFNDAMTIRLIYVTMAFVMLAFTLLLPPLLLAAE